MHKNKLTISRRRMVGGLTTAGLAAPFVMRSTRANAASNELTFVTWGGTYRAAVEQGAVKPFEEATGIKVKVFDTPDLAKVKAQVTTGNIEWDVFDAPGALGTSGAKEGYWEALDPALFDLDDLAVKPTKYLAPFYTFAGGIAWNPAKFTDGKHPTTFKEYFDAKAFPGRRTFRDRPSETLEAALLADGVAPDKLYPLDVDRAFASLAKIKSSVAQWVAATPQTITLLQTGEVDFSYTYASRVKTTNAAGAGMAFSFTQTLNGLEYLAVVKGAPNKDNAFKFVSYCLKPEVQAKTLELLSNTPVSKKAFPMLSEGARKWLPDMTKPDNVLLNDAWWADNFETVTRRFKEWIQT